jgi:threonine synthase
LGEKATQNKSAFELLDVLARTTGLEIPPGLKNLAQKTVRHTLVIDPAGMKQTVINSLTS